MVGEAEGPVRGDLEWGTVPLLVRRAAERYGDREAVVGPRTRISYRELGVRVERAAAAVMAAGIRPGDRVGIWAPNTPDYVVAALGALAAGGVLVPLGTRLKGAEAVDLLRRTRAALLFVTDAFLGVSYVSALRSAAGGAGPHGSGPLRDLPDLRTAVVLGDRDEAGEGFQHWRGFLAAAAQLPDRAVRERADAVRPEDPADIMFTSGTTGLPKGAITTHAQSLRAFATWAELAGLVEGDRYLVVNPFTHTFGWKAGVLASLMRGAVVLPQPVFDAGAVLAKISSEQVTVLPGAPTVYQSLLDHPGRAGYDLRSLRLAVTGAAVVPLELVTRIREELGFRTVLTAYGLTESCGLVTMGRRGDDPGLIAATSGRAVPGVTVRIADGESGSNLAQPPGTPGEVQVRGYTVMREYFEDPAGTEEAFTDDGWLRTGDIGVLDADGNLRITDRLKDMFTVGGFNAYPAEIEQVLSRHPLVADVAVVGMADPRLGEVGKAFVVASGSLDGAELIAWSRREMANYKVPRQVEFVTELPRNASGKVLKGMLRAGTVQ
ncbi:FadD3 family acyl-CoA ligase [Streptacidiphilus sp. N1-12]|uniref:FadD3 family acyl-CoA ligase n=2 Tax=Streptacidiphilus alkalitolerans TaxID=3342712 RepID=A0ABV6WPA3_9ACTN